MELTNIVIKQEISFQELIEFGGKPLTQIEEYDVDEKSSLHNYFYAETKGKRLFFSPVEKRNGFYSCAMIKNGIGK